MSYLVEHWLGEWIGVSKVKRKKRLYQKLASLVFAFMLKVL